MKLPNRAKIVWWLLLLGFFAYLLSQRYDSIMSGAASATDIVIFLIFIALFSAPLFQEVDFFGVRLKREIDTLRTEFKEQIVNLKSDIQNTINMRTEISPQIYLQAPPPDSEIPTIKEISKTALVKVKKKRGIETPATTVPEEISSLFNIRYNIEEELQRITKIYWLIEDLTYYPKTANQMLNFLTRMQIIHRDLAFIIKDIIAWCNSAIHGEEISEDAREFVQEIAPTIIEALKVIPEETKTNKE